MKTALHESITDLYENHGLSVAQIAQQMELEEVIVVSSLLQFSSVYKNGEGASDKEEELVSKQEVKEFLNEYKAIARYSDDPFLKERTLRNLINVGLKVHDGIGESNPRKLLQVAAGTGNILELNSAIKRAREAKERIRNKVIDVQVAEPLAVEVAS